LYSTSPLAVSPRNARGTAHCVTGAGVPSGIDTSKMSAHSEIAFEHSALVLNRW
jgi:hypothetical protein